MTAHTTSNLLLASNAFLGVRGIENYEAEGWIQTFKKDRFNLLDPWPDDIDIEDIAHHLSNQCRFTGAVSDFYSVAQHCVYVSKNVPEGYELEGLLHDAAEAYWGDLARPAKRLPQLAGYRDHEDHLQQVINVKYGLPLHKSYAVEIADRRMLATEGRDLMRGVEYGIEPFGFRVWPVSPREAKALFLERFKGLYKK